MPGDDATVFDFVLRLQEQVQQFGACSLDGVSIVYDRFMDILWRSVSRGFVSHENALFVTEGLWSGFDLGINMTKIVGRRCFRNYRSALEARPQLSKATRARVEKGKTLKLCLVPHDYSVSVLRDVIPFPKWRIFPLGAVPKPLEPDEMRPVSD